MKPEKPSPERIERAKYLYKQCAELIRLEEAEDIHPGMTFEDIFDSIWAQFIEKYPATDTGVKFIKDSHWTSNTAYFWFTDCNGRKWDFRTYTAHSYDLEIEVYGDTFKDFAKTSNGVMEYFSELYAKHKKEIISNINTAYFISADDEYRFVYYELKIRILGLLNIPTYIYDKMSSSSDYTISSIDNDEKGYSLVCPSDQIILGKPVLWVNRDGLNFSADASFMEEVDTNFAKAVKKYKLDK